MDERVIFRAGHARRVVRSDGRFFVVDRVARREAGRHVVARAIRGSTPGARKLVVRIGGGGVEFLIPGIHLPPRGVVVGY